MWGDYFGYFGDPGRAGGLGFESGSADVLGFLRQTCPAWAFGRKARQENTEC